MSTWYSLQSKNLRPAAALGAVLLLGASMRLDAQYPPQQQQPYPQQQYPQQQQQPYPQQQYPQRQQYPQQPPYPAQPPYANQAPPPMMSPQQLDQLVGPIALYPDPLLAQVLTASTFWNDIPAAASWADQHAYIHGEQLAQAIQADNLPWDASVLALLPFPSVLDQMARDMGWTQQLANAVLAQRGQVMDAVQQMRQEAYNYGYLRSDEYVRVMQNAGYIEVVPVNPGLIYVPVYNPYVVYVRPRPGLFVGGAIHFGPAITIGAFFNPFGWGSPGFGWREHNIMIDRRPWVRTWVNRGAYVHPYNAPRSFHGGPRVESHDVRQRDDHRDHRDDRHDHH